MHLFKNKTKDVKQFLEEMKANKTNRSSNHNSLQKSNKSVASSSHSQNPYQNNSVGNLNKLNHQNRRSSINSVDSRDSNRSLNGSVNSNAMRFNSGGTRLYPSPPQPIIQRPNYDQPQFRNPDNRQIIPLNNQFPPNYVNPILQSLNYEHDLSKHSAPYYTNQRHFNSFDDSRNFHSQSFHNISQPMRSHNLNNSPQLYPVNKNHVNHYGFSQNSNTTIYEKPQQYQNFSKNYQDFNKNLRKPQQSHYMTQSSNHHVLKMKNENDHHIGHFNNSQQFYNNRFNQHKSFTSQVNLSSFQVSNFDYEMQQISEAQPGLSTQKDTPAKISQFFSKDNNSNPYFKQTPIKKITQSNIFQEFEEELNGTQSQKKVSQTQKDKKISDINKFNKGSLLISQKVELKTMQIQTEIQEKTKKIQLSQNQRLRLNKNFHQIHDTYLEIDKLFKQTSILFNNIQRASDQFNKKIKSNGNYLKYLNQNVNTKNIYPKMEIEEIQRTDQTLKKQNNHKKMNNEQNLKTFKKDNRIQQFQI